MADSAAHLHRRALASQCHAAADGRHTAEKFHRQQPLPLWLRLVQQDRLQVRDPAARRMGRKPPHHPDADAASEGTQHQRRRQPEPAGKTID